MAFSPRTSCGGSSSNFLRNLYNSTLCGPLSYTNKHLYGSEVCTRFDTEFTRKSYGLLQRESACRAYWCCFRHNKPIKCLQLTACAYP